jgi:hypothetical protein
MNPKSPDTVAARQSKRIPERFRHNALKRSQISLKIDTHDNHFPKWSAIPSEPQAADDEPGVNHFQSDSQSVHRFESFSRCLSITFCEAQKVFDVWKIELLLNGHVFRVLNLALRQVFANFATKLLPVQYPVTSKVSTEVLEMLPYLFQKKRPKWPRQTPRIPATVRRIWFRTEWRVISASSIALSEPRKEPLLNGPVLRELFEVESLLNGRVFRVLNLALRQFGRISQKNRSPHGPPLSWNVSVRTQRWSDWSDEGKPQGALCTCVL